MRQRRHDGRGTLALKRRVRTSDVDARAVAPAQARLGVCRWQEAAVRQRLGVRAPSTHGPHK
jgi:hypothetical protein